MSAMNCALYGPCLRFAEWKLAERFNVYRRPSDQEIGDRPPGRGVPAVTQPGTSHVSIIELDFWYIRPPGVPVFKDHLSNKITDICISHIGGVHWALHVYFTRFAMVTVRQRLTYRYMYLIIKGCRISSWDWWASAWPLCPFSVQQSLC